MKHRVALVAVTILFTGCYTTKVYTPLPITGPEIKDRQWFTIGGLVPLSDPTGAQCPGGLSRSESQMAGMDILINVGLALVGVIGGAAACSGGDETERNSCATAGASLVPFLIGSRTVSYVCAGGVGPGPGPAPWGAPGQPPPAPYPPLNPAPPPAPAAPR
jgi:hypothetical protein